MDDQSDDEMPLYKSNRYSKKNESSESPLSISDEEDDDLLEIKPPQAKIVKHSHYRYDKHPSSGRQVYISSGSYHHKSHHSRRHQDERYFKDRFDDEFKSSRSMHVKEYESERVKEYDDYRKKKQPSHSHRHKQQDLREKLERRKLNHQKEYDRKEKEWKEKDRDVYRKETGEKRKRHHHESSRRRDRIIEKVDNSRHEKDKTPLVSISEDSFSPQEKEMVVDIEVSPPVLKDQYTDRYKEDDEEEEEDDEEEEEEEEGEKETAAVDEDEEQEENSNDGSSSESSSSSDSTDDSDSSDSSSNKEEDEEDDEGEEKESENEAKAETNNESNEAMKEETPPRVVSTNDDVGSDIELEKDTLPSYFPAIQGCRSVEEFQCLNRIEEGTYGVVYRAREKRTNKIVALKRLKMEKEKEGFPITSLREINTLLKAQHPNIVTVKEIVVGSNMDKIFIVMDYVEHDLKSLMETMKQKNTSFTKEEIKCLMQQLLQAVNHLHDNWILHRDLKTSNLLLSDTGILKVGDFGLAREYGSPLKPYTPVVVTLWYRAPELLLGTKEYSTSIDIWSVGCIFAEFLRMEPLFPGKTEVDQLNRIFKALGTPTEREWPEYPKFSVVQKVSFTQFPPKSIHSEFMSLTDVGYDLLRSFLTYNTKKRVSADTALKHEYFSEPPKAIKPHMFRKWPAKSDPSYRKAIASSPKPPSGGAGYKELREDDGFYIGVGEQNSRGVNVLASTFNLKF